VKGSDFLVRTNHGAVRSSIGYNDGDDFLSSRVRKSTIENVIGGDETPETLMAKMSQKHREEDRLNPFRNGTEGKLYTTSQIVMDLDDLKFYFKPIEGKCDFRGIKSFVNNPKIKIVILEDLA
jgi:hypothetical protein